jgi:putative ABC transport system permease protein
MLNSYLKIAWRALWRNRVFSTINIGGLAIGIAGSVILLCYVSFELSYDNFHLAAASIYRVNLDFYQDGQLTLQTAENYSPVGPALKKDFPEVLEQARLYNMGYKNNCVFSYGSTYFRETKFLYADPSFLGMFSFPFLQGDAASALTQPYTAVISESTAKKIFGEQGIQKAIGKSIQMNDDDRNSELCLITGVFKDVPENSHLRFNILISWSTLYRRGNGSGLDRFEHLWERKDFYTYVKLRPGVDPGLLSARLTSFVARHIPAEKSRHQESRMSLEPLSKIHFGTGRLDAPEPGVHETAVGFLLFIAFFIITIAWVNYINLATANSVNRAREIGVRKVLGSRRSQLIRQFLVESVCLNTISLVLAIFLIYTLRPFIHQVISIDITLTLLFTNRYALLFLFFLFAGAFFSGLYPALVLSSFKPVAVFKGKAEYAGKGLTLRRSLVVFQFALSILLIIGTIVVNRQVHYMLSQDLGMSIDQVMVLDRPGRWDTARSTHNLLIQRFAETLKNDPAVEAIGMSDEKPGKEIRWPSGYAPKNTPFAHSIPINTTVINEQYLAALGIPILAGRNFSAQFKTDNKGLLLTASAARLLGFAVPSDAIGKELHSDDGDYTVLGVVNDFHQLALQKEETPSAFQFNRGDLREFEYYLVKLKTSHVHQAVDRIEAAWKTNFKGNPFSFSFLQESFNQQYESEIRFGFIFGIFSFLAIVIACIGLFALTAFIVRQRTREIGLRKILGASLQDILFLVTKDFIRLVLLANLIAWPLGWVLMNGWLKDFAYRIHLSWLIFVLAGAVALLIALITISFQAVAAALANPIKSLRTE